MNIQISKEFADDLIKQVQESNLEKSVKTLVTSCIEQAVMVYSSNHIMSLLTTEDEMKEIQDKIVSDIKDKIKYPTVVGWTRDPESGSPNPVVYSCSTEKINYDDEAIMHKQLDALNSYSNYLIDGELTKWYPYSWMYTDEIEESAEYYAENYYGWVIDPVIIYPKV